MDLNALRAKRASVAKQMHALAHGDENQTWTDKEADDFAALEREDELLERQIKACERAEALGQDLERVPEQAMRAMPNGEDRQPDPETGITNVGELLYLARFRPNDSRILALQQMESGSTGGFAVPAQFEKTIRELQQAEAVFRPRATIIPAGDSPDAEITIPALDQGTADKNMFAGVTFDWIAEGGEPTGSDAYLREVKLKSQEAAGNLTITNKLLRNWQAAGALIERLMSKGIVALEDTVFYNGDGVGKPRGVINTDARLDQARDTANQIKFVDVVTMLSLVRRGMGLFWLASDATLPQLCQMVDAGSNLVWQPSAREGEPDRLMGKPILWSERSVNLGTRGDLCLLDLSYYLVKDGLPITIEASPHVYFKANKTVVKSTVSVDGQSWLKEPITTEGGRQRSPFVILE